MSWVGSWLYNKNTPVSISAPSLDVLSEVQEPATLIMNDDLDGAEHGLNEGDSSFHKLGKGIIAFIRATLGLEQDIMREAAAQLAEADASASNDQRKSQHKAHTLNAYQSPIYSPGTEYLLCQIMAQLMAALVGVLNENLMESIKAFYKLRKAYIALDGIMHMEKDYLDRTGRHSATAENSKATTYNPLGIPTSAARSPTVEGSNQQDEFIHSGANLCFGLLLLLISMVPPAFNRLLYITGFKGDRSRGLRMLWRASKFHSLTGAVAAVAILAFYNSFVRCCDILPDSSSQSEDDVDGYPRKRLSALLTEMRDRFPRSQLWRLEQSRMEGAQGNLENALQLLMSPVETPLKQVEALCVFERSMNAMYLHQYELCAKSFLECVELNSWSHALYYYIAGASHLALYRQNLGYAQNVAAGHAAKAVELFLKVPQYVGKKRFLASQLPFDTLVARKIAKWQSRAKQWNVDFIDAIGVDPIEEMIYFWNGHSRMSSVQLEKSLRNLNWFESEQNKTWGREDLDERAILALLRASIFRFLERHGEAKEVLQSQILCHDKANFKGHLKDDWTCPSAHYEMAANLWMERRYLLRPTEGIRSRLLRVFKW
ncbi:conserved hypothetical protein [Uncinocarpus reesii 1704]|uniref:Inclusion body clearance protein IML2 n=1 Tax=Uncinocarpus reesii (strain UAMH 1704) TaxID=336963 RepID=C4JQT4_UNCRE|nr:uncharacterized protein UREG_03416 [Uncinocarpus reesii 1704]EEP78570.1 conserved hypothetical protein [Uncinocarpus reesii 1704]